MLSFLKTTLIGHTDEPSCTVSHVTHQNSLDDLYPSDENISLQSPQCLSTISSSALSKVHVGSVLVKCPVESDNSLSTSLVNGFIVPLLQPIMKRFFITGPYPNPQDRLIAEIRHASSDEMIRFLSIDDHDRLQFLEQIRSLLENDVQQLINLAQDRFSETSNLISTAARLLLHESSIRYQNMQRELFLGSDLSNS
ncbi:unnamed protein product [Protopolystoma xenopodis]|uniref:Uncharacterized protein n=1 Tax=Protopolystoma xenopodis TaxID=117903 RepID=A0A3S5AE62_9PLAT|nr:unnamed protein product [Protopolystoma xenopodis]